MGEARAWIKRKLADMPDDWVGTVRWLLSSVRGYRGQLTLLSVLRTSSVLLGVASAAVNRTVIDAATAHFGRRVARHRALRRRPGGLERGLHGLSWLSTVLGERLSNGVRERLYRHVLGARWDSLSAYHSEQLLARLTSDVTSISSGLTGTAVSLLAMAVQAVAAFALLLHYDASLAVFVVVLTPVAVLTSTLVSVRLRILQQRVQQAEADYRQRAQEAIAHVEVVKALCAEPAEAAALSALQGEHERLLRRRARLTVVANGVMSLAFVGSYLFAFVHGILGIMGGSVTYGTFAAFLSLVGQVQSSLAGLSGILPRAASVIASRGARASASFRDPPRGAFLRGREEPRRRSPRRARPRPRLRLSRAPRRRGAARDRRALPRHSARRDRGRDGPLGHGQDHARPPAAGPAGAHVRGSSPSCGRARPSRPGHAATRWATCPRATRSSAGPSARTSLMGRADATEDDMRRALSMVRALDLVERLPGGLDAGWGARPRHLRGPGAAHRHSPRPRAPCQTCFILDEATSALDEQTNSPS